MQVRICVFFLFPRFTKDLFRELIARQSNEELKKLLGFKGSCLLAPSEASIWTRFCEVDVVEVVSSLHNGLILPAVPVEVVRFEQHMNEPVRMHNIYKQAREQANQTENGGKVKRKDRVEIKCTTPKEQLLIEHRFAEGISFTIADIILYPLLKIIFQHCGQMLPHFPLTSTWFSEVRLKIIILDQYFIFCLLRLMFLMKAVQGF